MLDTLKGFKKTLALVLLAAVLPLNALGAVKDGIAAIVDDEVITLVELSKTVEVAKARAMASGMTLPSESEINKQVLDLMIDNKLQLQQVHNHGLTLTEAELSQAIENIEQQRHMTPEAFKAALAKEHMSLAEFKDSIKEQLLIQKLASMALSHKVTVTDEEANQTWHKMQGQLAKYDVVDYWFSTENQQALGPAEKVMQHLSDQLKKGDKASVLLKQDANSAVQKNAMSGRSLSQLPQLFSSALSDMPVHGVSSPIKAENGYHVLVLANKKGGLSKSEVKQRLFMQKMSEKRQHWLQQLRAMAYVKINL